MGKDILKEIAEYYQNELNGKDFVITAGKNNKTIEFTLSFESSNFKHLVGLHKLSDISECKKNSTTILSHILEGNFTYEDISKSKYISFINERINNFQKIGDTLSKNSNLLESSDGYFRTINADFMVFKNIGDEQIVYSHLFLKDDKEKGIVVPVSYFSRSDSRYLNLNAKRWKVLNVERVKSEFEKSKDISHIEKDNYLKQKLSNSIDDKQKDIQWFNSKEEEIRVLIKEPKMEAQELKITNCLQEYQRRVEGYIETLPFPGKDCCMDMVINDEAKLLKLDENISVPEYKDIVTGTIIVAGLNNDGSFRSLTDDEVKYAIDYFKEHEYTVEQQKDSKEYDRERDD